MGLSRRDFLKFLSWGMFSRPSRKINGEDYIETMQMSKCYVWSVFVLQLGTNIIF